MELGSQLKAEYHPDKAEPVFYLRYETKKPCGYWINLPFLKIVRYEREYSDWHRVDVDG